MGASMYIICDFISLKIRNQWKGGWHPLKCSVLALTSSLVNCVVWLGLSAATFLVYKRRWWTQSFLKSSWPSKSVSVLFPAKVFPD